MKIVIPGGSGHLGTLLARAFYPQHEVVVLSRRRAMRPWRTVWWDGVNLNSWAGEIDGADVVINLAGRSVNCRYTKVNERDILESRVQSTRVVGEAIAAAQNRLTSGCRRAPQRCIRIDPTRRAMKRRPFAKMTFRPRGASASKSDANGSMRSTRPGRRARAR
jgi:NAD dependent epimerase/dehydratase family